MLYLPWRGGCLLKPMTCLVALLVAVRHMRVAAVIMMDDHRQSFRLVEEAVVIALSPR
jgi:hypothetical protein